MCVLFSTNRLVLFIFSHNLGRMAKKKKLGTRQMTGTQEIITYNAQFKKIADSRCGSRILKWGVNFCNNVIEAKPG